MIQPTITALTKVPTPKPITINAPSSLFDIVNSLHDAMLAFYINVAYHEQQHTQETEVHDSKINKSNCARDQAITTSDKQTGAYSQKQLQ